MVLTDLGRLYFDQLDEDQAYLKPVSPLDATINPILSIKVRAFVAKSLTRSSGQQTVYVIVQSQTGQLVSNVTGKVTIHWPNGRAEDYFFTTNSAGLGTGSNLHYGSKLLQKGGKPLYSNISFQLKTGPSLQASFQLEFSVTAHTPHSAIPPQGMGVWMRICASFSAAN